jgi:hypothetical protein
MTKMKRSHSIADGKTHTARNHDVTSACKRSVPRPLSPYEADQRHAHVTGAIYVRDLFSRVVVILTGRDLEKLTAAPLPFSDARKPILSRPKSV